MDEMDQIVKHPYFDLYLHGTAKLEQLAGVKILQRETIHEWPLSTVQRLTCADGQRLIYKSQSAATLEARFYEQARSPLLPRARSLGRLNGCETMLLEFIEGERLADRRLAPRELLELGRRVAGEIAAIQGDVPVYTDISTSDLWRAFVEATVQKLERLIVDGVFTKYERAMVQDLRRWAQEASVLRTIDEQAALCHGDLNAGNILFVGDQIMLIDWQRPRRAPRDTDLAYLLHGQRLDPYQYVGRESAQIYEFLLAHWFIECKASYFPTGSPYEAASLERMVSLLGH
jgi:hypothetical protein